MNKIVYDANVTDLCAKDYDYVQNQSTEEFFKLFRQFIETPYISAIIKGFDLEIYKGIWQNQIYKRF